jgi:8-oxo-dGTP pyrophosphatase MutT (NUDIX family)
LREETGLTAGRWLELLRLHTSNSITDESGFVFLARDLTEGPTEFEDTEDLAIRMLPLAEALDWVHQGQITDAMSVAGILRLAADADRLLG